MKINKPQKTPGKFEESQYLMDKVPKEPRDLGLIMTPENNDTSRRRPVLPISLRGRTFTFGTDFPPEKCAEYYGTWRVRAIKSYSLGFGRYVFPGDEFIVDGQECFRSIEKEQAICVDPRFLEEEEAIRKGRALIESVKRLPIDTPGAVHTQLPTGQANGPRY
jgi:hypothetical protein